MRKFGALKFPHSLQGSRHIKAPTQDSRDALGYMQQYTNRFAGNVRLCGGYLPDKYVRGLQELEIGRNEHNFSAAMDRLVSGDVVSEEVTTVDTLKPLELTAERDTIVPLYDVKDQTDSDQIFRDIRLVQKLLKNVDRGDTVTAYIPEESHNFIKSNLISTII